MGNEHFRGRHDDEGESWSETDGLHWWRGVVYHQFTIVIGIIRPILTNHRMQWDRVLGTPKAEPTIRL
jgi:hypothetical protein